jgi:hypothetical protein
MKRNNITIFHFNTFSWFILSLENHFQTWIIVSELKDINEYEITSLCSFKLVLNRYDKYGFHKIIYKRFWLSFLLQIYIYKSKVSIFKKKLNQFSQCWYFIKFENNRLWFDSYHKSIIILISNKKIIVTRP